MVNRLRSRKTPPASDLHRLIPTTMELSPSSTHPNPQPHPHHRKIELQSPLDLTYLQSNLSTSAQQKVDLHFPPTAYRPQPPPAKPAEFISLDGPSKDASILSQPTHTQSQPQSQQEQVEEDPFRARVRQLVDAFLSRTWQGAAHSISINGLDASTLPSTAQTASLEAEANGEREGVDFKYTPYDGKLQNKVASLYGELEMLTAQVSKLRREAPKAGAEMYERRLREGIQDDGRKWNAMKEKVRKEGAAEKGIELDDVRDGWHEDVKSMYEKGMDELVKLAGLAKDEQGRGGSLTETVGTVQRARTVAMEFE